MGYEDLNDAGQTSMSEKDQQMIEIPKVETSAESINNAISREETRLAHEYENIPGEEYKIFLKPDIRNYFRWDTEAICRHSLVNGTEAIIFLDQSARGYGLMAKKMLPIIRLEYAKLNRVDPDNVTLPEVYFVDPPKEVASHKSQDSETFDEVKNDLINKLGKRLEGKNILVVDEATMSIEYPVHDNRYFQENTVDINKEYTQFRDSERRRKYRGNIDSEYNTIRGTARLFKHLFRPSDIDFHIVEVGQPSASDPVYDMKQPAWLYKSVQSMPNFYQVMNADWSDPNSTTKEDDEEFNRRRSEAEKRIPHTPYGLTTGQWMARLAYGTTEYSSHVEPGRGGFSIRTPDSFVTEDTKQMLKEMGYESVGEFRDRVRLEQAMLAKETLKRVANTDNALA